MATTESYRPRSSIYGNISSRPWRLKRNGLNIEALCTNSRCLAYNQMVVINLGIGEFDFARLILGRKNKCPTCLSKVHPTKYALIRCQWRYVLHYSTQEFPLNIVHDTYQLNDLPCEYIIIETMPLPTSDRLDSTSQAPTCSICLSHIHSDHADETSHLRCSHAFHRDCIARWLQSSAPMANTCPLCRVDVAERRSLN